MFSKIGTRLTSAFIALAVLPILFLGTFIAQKTYSAARENAISVTQQTALRVAGEVESFIRDKAGHLELLTKVHGLQGLPRVEQRRILQELLLFQNAYDEISLLDNQGRELIKVHRTRIISDTDLASRANNREFQASMQTRKPYFGPVLFRPGTGEPYMICAVPLFDTKSGAITGLLVGDLRLKKMWDLLAAIKHRPGENVYIANQQGLIIAHKNPSIVLRGTRTTFDLAGAEHNMENHIGLFTDEAIIGDHDIFLGEQRLHVISEWQKENALSLAYRMLLVIGSGTLAALSAAILLVIPVVSAIVRPIRKLAATARRIEQGDINEEAGITNNDEIGELARAFNRMTAQLRTSVTALRTEVAERADIQKALQRELLINESLAAVSKVMLASDDINEIAQEVLQRAQALTDSEHGYVGYIDPRTASLVTPTITAMLGKECRLMEQNNRLEFPAEPGGHYGHLWGVSLNTKEAFIANTPASHPAADGCPEGHVPLVRFMSVPVLFNNRLIGQISLANGPIDYERRDIEAIERLARLYALALNRVHTLQEKEQLISNLRQSQKMEAIGTLAGGIAHDFNNMLTPILGYSEIALLRLKPGDDLFEHIEAIHLAANRAKELIKQILTFSRQQEHELVPVTMQPILRETIKLLRSSLPTTIELREDIAPECGAIMADLTQLQQVVMNLGTNAYHAMDDAGGILSISLRQAEITPTDPLARQGLPPGRIACLEISDTGSGMDGATLQRIFEPYFTTKEKGKGTGMGLAMVHAIISNHKGHINVYSEPGRGTTFKIYLPVIPAAEQGREQEKSAPATGGSEQILLVDDEEPIVLMLRDMLRNLGYQVTAITRSPEALDVFQAHPDKFDLVITDQTMPELTGGQLAKEMLAIRADLPIILCTGFSEILTEEMARQIGIRQYIMKPVIIQELAQKIRAVLETD
ncbi:MAG: hypothetical protein C0613_10565 [Desulfobulbaceae bacterium]|nr:MAG: hypothetical protein C0613_10565 [Desulfobulbaceae bacterium]